MNDILTFFVYLLVMAGVTYLLRVLPLLFIKKKITNRFIVSFLYYVPYVVLTVMILPTLFYVTDHTITGILAAAVCAAVAYFRPSIILVAISGSVTVLLSELAIAYLVPLIA